MLTIEITKQEFREALITGLVETGKISPTQRVRYLGPNQAVTVGPIVDNGPDEHLRTASNLTVQLGMVPTTASSKGTNRTGEL